MPSRSLVEEPGSQGTQGKGSVHAAFGARSPCSSGFAFQERDPDESLEGFFHMGNSGTRAGDGILIPAHEIFFCYLQGARIVAVRWQN